MKRYILFLLFFCSVFLSGIKAEEPVSTNNDDSIETYIIYVEGVGPVVVICNGDGDEVECSDGTDYPRI